MDHVHKLIRLSNGESIIGQVLEKSLRHDSYQISITNVFKLHQQVAPDAYMMTTLTRYLHMVDEQYININKDHVTFICDVNEDVITFMENYEEEEYDDDIEEKLAIAGIAANSLGIIH